MPKILDSHTLHNAARQEETHLLSTEGLRPTSSDLLVDQRRKRVVHSCRVVGDAPLSLGLRSRQRHILTADTLNPFSPRIALSKNLRQFTSQRGV